MVGIIIASLCFAGFVYALYTTVSWTQTLQVPPGKFIAYTSNGTEITEGSDQTSMWTWNVTTSSFNTTVRIKNVGSAYINVYVNCTLEPSSNWTTNGFGRQNAIAVDELRSVDLSINKTLAFSNETIPLFTITMTIVP